MILVTAFEPFGGKTWNASSMILERLNGVMDKRLLPVSISGAKTEIEMLDVSPYQAIIMLGEANRSFLSLEQFAYNEIDMRIPDNTGVQIHHQTIDDGQTYQTPFQLDPWVKSGILISEDPGRYLCNYAYYLMGKKHPNVLFIHVSADKDQIDLQTKEIEEIIDEIKTISIAR
jgi:pyrrolidone-carboxylate peptidase